MLLFDTHADTLYSRFAHPGRETDVTPETLKNGAMAGAMFETFVINEILKSYSNEGLEYDFNVFYYNGKDKKKRRENGEEVEVDGEIDLIILENGILYPKVPFLFCRLAIFFMLIITLLYIIIIDK